MSQDHTRTNSILINITFKVFMYIAVNKVIAKQKSKLMHKQYSFFYLKNKIIVIYKGVKNKVTATRTSGSLNVNIKRR